MKRKQIRMNLVELASEPRSMVTRELTPAELSHAAGGLPNSGGGGTCTFNDDVDGSATATGGFGSTDIDG